MVDENGVSEIIGAILLVSLVILGAMIVSVLFLSQPPPQEIPQVNAIAGNDTVGGVEYIYLLHDGGDPLTPIETVIRIDGERDPGTIEISTEDGSYEPWTSGEWSVGKTLRITDDQPPQSVSLVYSGGSSQALLLTSTFVETGSGGGGGPVPPVSLKADFTGMPRSGPAPLTVTFTDLSTGNPTQWVWNFGDGATSTEKNPDHTYTAPGTYTVTLTVTNAGGSDPETKLNFITVSSLSLKAEFEAYPTSGDAPLTVQFTDLSTGNPTQWNWDFGDGSTSTDQNPEHTYTTPGTYTVTLAATNAGGSDPETKPNYITVLSPTPDCGTISGYKWNDQNGNGEKDPDEPGLEGWTINLYKLEWQWNHWEWEKVNEYITDQNGHYIFTRLTYQSATWYMIEEEQQSGWQLKKPEQGYYVIKLQNPGSGPPGQPGKCYETDINFGNKENIPGPIYGNTIIFNKQAGGYLVDDTYIEFKIPQQGSPNFDINIYGYSIDLKKGDIVRLVINGNQNTGDADFKSTQITRFNFNVDVYVNGELKGSGYATNVECNPYESFTSTLAFHMPSIMADTQLTIDGVQIISSWPWTNDIIDLTNMGVPADGQARIDITPINTYIDCSGYYSIS